MSHPIKSERSNPLWSRAGCQGVQVVREKSSGAALRAVNVPKQQQQPRSVLMAQNMNQTQRTFIKKPHFLLSLERVTFLLSAVGWILRFIKCLDLFSTLGWDTTT